METHPYMNIKLWGLFTGRPRRLLLFGAAVTRRAGVDPVVIINGLDDWVAPLALEREPALLAAQPGHARIRHHQRLQYSHFLPFLQVPTSFRLLVSLQLQGRRLDRPNHTPDKRCTRVRVQLIGHARNNM